MSENGNNHTASSAIGGEYEVVKRFAIILRTGETINVPYALLPVIMLTEQSELVIRAYGLLIKINGRNMRALAEYATQEILVFAKESPSGKDTGEDFIFISDIKITGRTVSKELREGEI